MILGQKINLVKSKLFFSKNVSVLAKEKVIHELHIQEGHKFGKYLGFPMFMSKSTKQDFQFLLDNFKNRLAG